VEFCRNILNIPDANTYEFIGKIKSDNWVIIDMPEASLTILGGTMRRGLKKTIIKKYTTELQESLAYKIYKEEVIYERYRHRYELNK
jgi:CTP synthase